VAADRWLGALEALAPTPPRYRERSVGEAEALDVLRCDRSVLEALVGAGLPVVGADGEGQPLFDFHDLINVGLYSGTGASLGEMGERVLMRFAAENPERWLGPRRWAVEVDHVCAGDGEAAWSAARPAPEIAAGRCESWAVVGADASATLQLAGVVEVSGRAGSVVAAPARELYREWLADIRGGRLRFQWLPGPMRLDPEEAYRRRLTDCVAAALMLERQLGGLGLEARTRKGHVLGLMSVEHAWAELRDADGEWKLLDPILAVVAHRAGTPRPEFDDFCLGSIANRVVPWDRRADQALAVHECRSGAAVVTNVVGAAAR
jgi:hypothetical protein